MDDGNITQREHGVREGGRETRLRNAVSSKEMMVLEEKGQKIGISKLMMMENAGSSISSFVYELISKSHPKSKKTIVIVSGTGNNGGDTFVAARHLAYWPNLRIVLALIGREKDIQAEEARTNWRILSHVPQVRIITIDEDKKLGLMESEIKNAAIVIVGIFGTGFRGVPRQLQLRAIERLNALRKPIKISVDIPSGMEADSGMHNYSIKSDYTITMHSPKSGMIMKGADKFTGKIIEANIGLPF